jgi:hypothetical protein
VSLNAGAYKIIEPSFREPEILLQFQQASGFVDLLEGGKLRTRLAEDDLLVYMKQLNIRTKLAGSQATYEELPGIDIAASMISTMTYQFRARSEYNHHDVAAGSRWGFAVPEAYRLGMRQAHFQQARDAALNGLQPQNGEGFLNAPGATLTNLPADQFGNDTATTYDNGQAAFFFAQQIKQMKTLTLQMGIRGLKFTILGPQRTLGLWEYNIVELTAYQRPGAGSASTVETLKAILMANGDELIWAYDDTLQGAGGNSDTDLVILAMPEVEVPAGPVDVNTNVFATLQPNNPTCLTQYNDMAAPREIISPLAGGATDVLTEWRISPGWAPRPQALTIISIVYQ